jgi:DNA polymerase-4
VDPSFDPKSCGTETTFDRDIINPNQLLAQMEAQSEEVSLGLKKMEKPGKTVTLKIKYNDFTSITRSRTLFHPTYDSSLIFQIASELLYRDTLVGSKPVRLIGISVKNLIHEEEPQQLWFNFS